MNSRFFTADSHFGDSGLIKLDNRPFSSAEEMDETMIRNWNSVVTNADHVYHLGDFGRASDASQGNLLAVIKRLNGNIHLIAGNHDSNNVWKHRKQFASWQDYKEINVEGQWIVLCHYPMRSWRHLHKGGWHLFGHVHGNMGPWGKSFDVGVKTNGWTPLSFPQVAAKMATLSRPVQETGPDFEA